MDKNNVIAKKKENGSYQISSANHAKLWFLEYFKTYRHLSMVIGVSESGILVVQLDTAIDIVAATLYMPRLFY